MDSKLDCREFILDFEHYRVFTLQGEPVLVQRLTYNTMKGDHLWRELFGRLRKQVIHEWQQAKRQLDLFQEA